MDRNNERQSSDIDKARIYMQILSNYENELFSMRNYIQFDKENIASYSVKLAELILVCNSHIESLIDAILKKNGYKLEKKLTNIPKNKLNAINSKLELQKKKIIYDSSIAIFNIDNEYNNRCPLQKNEKGDYEFTVIYNAIKHNYVNSLHKATLEEAFRVLAVFVILLYYFIEGIEGPTEKKYIRLFTPTTAKLGIVVYNALTNGEKTIIKDYISGCMEFEWLEKNFSPDFVKEMIDFIPIVPEEFVLKNPDIFSIMKKGAEIKNKDSQFVKKIEPLGVKVTKYLNTKIEHEESKLKSLLY